MCGCLLHAPYWGHSPQPRHVPQTGNQTSDPLVRRSALNVLSHTSQGAEVTFIQFRNHETPTLHWCKRTHGSYVFCPHLVKEDISLSLALAGLKEQEKGEGTRTQRQQLQERDIGVEFCSQGTQPTAKPRCLPNLFLFVSAQGSSTFITKHVH